MTRRAAACAGKYSINVWVAGSDEASWDIDCAEKPLHTQLAFEGVCKGSSLCTSDLLSSTLIETREESWVCLMPCVTYRTTVEWTHVTKHGTT
jgi:hypothetical protein